MLIIIAICCSALAQIILKKASVLEFKSLIFFFHIGCAATSYFISFVLYVYIVKRFPVSKISPVMTIGTMILVVIAGFLMFKETLSLRLTIGLLLGIISIILILK